MSMEKEVSKFRSDYWTFEATCKKPTLLHFWQILGTKKACLHLHTKTWSLTGKRRISSNPRIASIVAFPEPCEQPHPHRIDRGHRDAGYRRAQ